ncbi:MAG: hypothetical protein NTZ92_08340, partial [Candidatus Omnitrophica bacterium]|nr:hypothetical protein [Candidatus Omnitrophota bacterium]
GIVLIGLAYYWFEWRPYYIRRICLEKAFDYTEETNLATRNNLYRGCLIKRGLPPESVFVNTD